MKDYTNIQLVEDSVFKMVLFLDTLCAIKCGPDIH